MGKPIREKLYLKRYGKCIREKEGEVRVQGDMTNGGQLPVICLTEGEGELCHQEGCIKKGNVQVGGLKEGVEVRGVYRRGGDGTNSVTE